MASIYLLQMFYDINGQECSNRFYYTEISVTAGDSNDLGLAFVADVLPAIGAAVSSLFSNQIFRIKNLDDFSDFSEFATTQVGLRSPTIQSTWDAWGFWMIGQDYRVRKGAKRFAGVSDSDVQDGEPVAAVVDELTALSAALVATVSGSTTSYKPILYSPPNQSHAGLLTPQITSAPFKRFTTQNSRKPW